MFEGHLFNINDCPSVQSSKEFNSHLHPPPPLFLVFYFDHHIQIVLTKVANYLRDY